MKSFHLSLISMMIAAVSLPTGLDSRLEAANRGTIFGRSLAVETVFRGQSPDADAGVPIPPDAGVTPNPMPSAAPPTSAPSMIMEPYTTDGIVSSPDMSMPVYQESTTWNAFSPPVTPDPFLTQPGYGVQPGPYAPYQPYGQPGGYQQPGIPQQGMSVYGANGAQPYRFGWSNRVDVSWIPGAGLSAPAGGATGDMDIFGVDYDLAYSSPFAAGWILNWTNQFAYRNWKGPGGINLPSDLFRFGIDLELETPQAGPVGWSFGITPSINTDFNSSVGGEGFQLDGRGIMFFQLDQYWTLGLGAQYWDRVDDMIIPWAGLIYRDDYWEWQMMYPEARVSLFLGNEAMWSKWLYVRGEYHVESYGTEIDYGGLTSEAQTQIEDYRILIGLKMDSGYYQWFMEGGWVLDRNVSFSSAAVPGYELDTAFIGQIGLRF